MCRFSQLLIATFGSGGAQLFEGSEVLFAVAADTVSLNGQVIDLTLVFEERLSLDQTRAEGFRLIDKERGEFDLAEGEDAVLECGNSIEAPFGICNGLD